MTDEKFSDLVTCYEKLVFTVCYQMVRDFGEAQNLTQETFLAAYRHIDDYQGDNYKPWLTRIAANKAKDYLKSAYVRRVQLDFDSTEERYIPLERSPDEIYVSKEGGEKIAGLIRALKEPYQKVSDLYFLKQKNTDEIAKILKRPKKTVQTQIYRAKIILQQLLKEGSIDEKRII
ncbi:MAG: sigma-70 family RNA polymerase sigma factor [Oscillospiraceae bacterium]|nr:sigma-70 family RNA polymerase sigma factor [Oscillospiraceae bacterium]